MAEKRYDQDLKDVGKTYFYLFVVIVIVVRWLFSLIKFIFTLIPRFIRWIFRLPNKMKKTTVTNPIKEIAALDPGSPSKKQEEDELDLLGLEEYQKDLVNKKEQWSHNFEEEDMDEDDYFHDDA